MGEPKSTVLTIRVADGVKPFLVQVAAKEDREGLWNLSSILFPQIGIEFKVDPGATGTFVSGETLAALADGQREYLDRLEAQREEWRNAKRPKKSGDAGGIQKNPKDSAEFSHTYSNSSSPSSSPSGEVGGGEPPPARAKRFAPPTVEEVAAYALEAGLTMDAARFVDYYTSNGWMAGRSPMKDWKAAARNWSKRDGEFGAAPASPAQPRPMMKPARDDW